MILVGPKTNQGLVLVQAGAGHSFYAVVVFAEMALPDTKTQQAPLTHPQTFSLCGVRWLWNVLDFFRPNARGEW